MPQWSGPNGNDAWGTRAALPRLWSQTLGMARLSLCCPALPGWRGPEGLCLVPLPLPIGFLNVPPVSGLHSSQNSPFPLCFLASRRPFCMVSQSLSLKLSATCPDSVPEALQTSSAPLSRIGPLEIPRFQDWVLIGLVMGLCLILEVIP